MDMSRKETLEVLSSASPKLSLLECLGGKGKNVVERGSDFKGSESLQKLTGQHVNTGILRRRKKPLLGTINTRETYTDLARKAPSQKKRSEIRHVRRRQACLKGSREATVAVWLRKKKPEEAILIRREKPSAETGSSRKRKGFNCGRGVYNNSGRGMSGGGGGGGPPHGHLAWGGRGTPTRGGRGLVLCSKGFGVLMRVHCEAINACVEKGGGS